MDDFTKCELLNELQDNYKGDVDFIFKIVEGNASSYEQMAEVRDRINECLNNVNYTAMMDDEPR